MNKRLRSNRLTLALVYLILVGATSAAPISNALDDVRFSTIAPGPAGCPLNPASYAFFKGFKDLGYKKDPIIDGRCFSQPSDIPSVVAEVLAAKPPLVAVWGSAAPVRLLHQADPMLPIVIVNISDPVENGLVQSLAHPGGSITGNSNLTEELLAKRIEILRDALPNAARLAVLSKPSDAMGQKYLNTTVRAARNLNFEARVYSVLAPSDFASAFDAMAKDQMEAIVILPDAAFYVYRDDIIALARRHRLPEMSYTTAYVESGGLFVYAANLEDMSYQAASYVDKILKGVKPGDMPIQLPVTFDFVINTRAARDIGLILPKAVLLRATRVID